MVTVNIPAPLRSASDGKRAVETGPGTVDAVLLDVCSQHEPLRVHLYHGNGAAKRHVFVAVNGAQASRQTTVRDGDVVDLLIATAGGTAA